MKLFSIFIFCASQVFSATIGVCGWTKGADYIRPYLEEQLTPLGHVVEGFWKEGDFDKYDIIVSCNTKSFLSKHKHKTIISTFEPPVIIPEHEDYDSLKDYLCIFTWNHNLENGDNIEKFYYPCDHIQNLDPSSMIPFEKRTLACMVNSHLTKFHPKELYSARKKVVKFYRKYYPENFSLYGKRGWGFGVSPVYKGKAESKDQVLKEHKFNYCFENWNNEYHYISEKIFESFNSLCVPIYLGSTNISDLIPPETYIDARKFKSIKHLHAYIENMDEETYMTYINEIVYFNNSNTAGLFSWENHHKRVLQKILDHLSLYEK